MNEYVQQQRMQHQNQQQLHDTTSQPGAPVGGGGDGAGLYIHYLEEWELTMLLRDFKIGKVKLIWS